MATSICMMPPLAHAQSEPGTNQSAKPTGISRAQRATAGSARPSSPILERSLSWTGGVLAVGAVALIASRKFLRPMGIADAALADQARICSRVQLTPRQMVHVVRIGSRTLVIGTGPQGSPVTLAQWSDENPDADTAEFGSSEFDADQDFWESRIRPATAEPASGQMPELPVTKNGAAA